MQVFFSIFWWIYFCIFFSGYPLAFAIVHLTAKNKKLHDSITLKIYPLLPLAYAFVTTCFWILMLCTGKMQFILEKIASATPSILVIFWSLTAFLFWLPRFRKNHNLSLIHSLPLFMLPPLNMLIKASRHSIVAHDYIINLLRIYTAGLIVYIIAIMFLLLIKWLLPNVFSFRRHSAKA